MKTLLMILDGWGFGKQNKSDAIFNAHTPFFDGCLTKYPNAQLLTDGEHVGLPEGQMGNSEVGHTNIGAGRVVYQDLAKINRAIRLGELSANAILQQAFHKAKTTTGTIHFMGLVSNGGVHSHQNHLVALVQLAHNAGLRSVIHAFTDGRDTDPKSGLESLLWVENQIANCNAHIATLVGRYYAMDRDKRWERVKKAYDLLVNGVGEKAESVAEALQKSYDNNTTDEFVEPVVLQPQDVIQSGDTVLCFNYRTDRCREITQVLTQESLLEFGMQLLQINYYTLTNYDKNFKNVHPIFDKDNLTLTLGEVVANAGLTQVRIAETEKYPHVTFFFSGGREEEFAGERRLLINSPKVATYDLQPEMSAQGIANAICTDMEQNAPDFICLNFANPDMVGHTGVYSAILKAVEKTDACAKQVAECAIKNNYAVVIIADHGNADFAINEDGTPNTAHTTNPVPIIIANAGVKKVANGILADVAPTILQLMQVPQPTEMTGKSLVV